MLKRRRNLTWRIFKVSSHSAVKFTNMETEKIGHILKGLADDTFNLRICENYDSVDTIIKESCNFELKRVTALRSSSTGYQIQLQRLRVRTSHLDIICLDKKI